MLAAGLIMVMVVVMVQPPPPELPAPIEAPATAPERAPEPLVVAPPPPCYVDDDGDGFAVLVASPSEAHACQAVEAFKGVEDCDDTNIKSFPGAPEFCDGIDNNCDGAEDGAPGECLKSALREAKIGLNANKSKSGAFIDVTVSIGSNDVCEHVKVGYGTNGPSTYGDALRPMNGSVSCSLLSTGSAAAQSTHKNCGAKRFNQDAISNDSGELRVSAQCCVIWLKSPYCEDVGKPITISYIAEGL
ncbi:putative metal-binding motif-containing protein [Myxococcota bacterium]|nr:putative metal-binding motif-containing protein [Myxococcota bacterium]